ncbi:hypothetical protein PPL_05219 [Heterostelium album PN500]|uniref:AMP-dependent synthetase/ligase domain-containing protein n=1 Tax=Heterostelium pallidum (strain ATCC 26659 / Pp 5 / PN500) TaxID=670386 RepID=D3B9S3_HETP5|nr:hypothetical protein PPL_05219 [Heterostelium album PN500]EFA81985.1 hypothetical protein PPL_05219 [Heterostelium album PN500]|eukprot:XP_020434102.1 hypothetical protein PPL_05219 [Heterostelium album PN500]
MVSDCRCALCLTTLVVETQRYLCSECHNISLCLKCYDSPKSHTVHTDKSPLPHQCSLETKSQAEYIESNKAESIYEGFMNAFKNFAKRRCIGECIELEDGSATYKWVTYQELFDRAQRFGNVIQKLIPYRSKVGIFLTNVPEWYTVDFGCLFYGYSVIGINQHLRNDLSPEIKNQIPSSIDIKLFSEIMNTDIKISPHTPQRDGIHSITYSSGSTGIPKGIIGSNTETYILGYPLDFVPIQLSYLSLAHTQRLTDFTTLWNGGRFGIYRDTKQNSYLKDNSLIRPTFIWGPTSFWNQLHTKYLKNVKMIKESDHSKSDEQCELQAIAETRNLLGDRIKIILTTGSIISPEAFALMKKCWGEKVLDIYGSAEINKVAINGQITPDVEYKLSPIDGYDSHNGHPVGLLKVRSTRLFKGYYKNPEANAKAFDKDGWYSTGDIVEEYGQGKIRIIDREKNSFKISYGKLVCLDNIDSYYYNSPMIRNIFVHVAIVVPTDYILNKFKIGKQDNIDENFELVKEIEKEIKLIANQKNIAFWEIPKLIKLDRTIWTMGNNLISGTGKYNRLKLLEYYKPSVDQLLKQLTTLTDNDSFI